MTTFNAVQLYALARSVGCGQDQATTAAAIALAESSGNSDATSSNPDGGTNVGLWQLDTKGAGAGYSVDQLKDPTTNAQVMYKASNGGSDWSAWQTYVQGTYEAHLTAARQGQQEESSGVSVTDMLSGIPVIGGLIGGVENTVSGVNKVAALIEAFFKVLTDGKMWRSLGWILLGLVILMVGANILLADKLGITPSSIAKGVAAVAK